MAQAAGPNSQQRVSNPRSRARRAGFAVGLRPAPPCAPAACSVMRTRVICTHRHHFSQPAALLRRTAVPFGRATHSWTERAHAADCSGHAICNAHSNVARGCSYQLRREATPSATDVCFNGLGVSRCPNRLSCNEISERPLAQVAFRRWGSGLHPRRTRLVDPCARLPRWMAGRPGHRAADCTDLSTADARMVGRGLAPVLQRCLPDDIARAAPRLPGGQRARCLARPVGNARPAPSRHPGLDSGPLRPPACNRIGPSVSFAVRCSAKPAVSTVLWGSAARKAPGFTTTIQWRNNWPWRPSRTPIGARTNFSPRSRTSCATPSRRCATLCICCNCANTPWKHDRSMTSWTAKSGNWRVWWTICSTSRASRAERSACSAASSTRERGRCGRGGEPTAAGRGSPHVHGHIARSTCPPGRRPVTLPRSSPICSQCRQVHGPGWARLAGGRAPGQRAPGHRRRQRDRHPR